MVVNRRLWCEINAGDIEGDNTYYDLLTKAFEIKTITTDIYLSQSV